MNDNEKCERCGGTLNASGECMGRPKPQATSRDAVDFEAIMREAFKMVNPFNPSGDPGSYSRGHYNGIVAALQTVRDLHTRAVAGTYPFAALASPPADAGQAVACVVVTSDGSSELCWVSGANKRAAREWGYGTHNLFRAPTVAAEGDAMLDWLEANELALASEREAMGDGYAVWWRVVRVKGIKGESISGPPLGNARDAIRAAMQRQAGGE